MTGEDQDLGRWLGSGRRVAIVSAALLALGTAPVFLQTFINDDATYALVARKLAAGGLLYRDAVDNKPPLIYLTFGAAYALFGSASLLAVKLLAAAVDLASAGLLFVIGRRLFSPRVGALAALLFSAAAVTGLAEDFAAPNTECFMNLFVLAALALLSREPERPRRRTLVAAGILVGVASLYRLQGAAALLATLSFFFLRRRTLRPRFLVVGRLDDAAGFCSRSPARPAPSSPREPGAICGCGRCATTSRTSRSARPASAGAPSRASR